MVPRFRAPLLVGVICGLLAAACGSPTAPPRPPPPPPPPVNSLPVIDAITVQGRRQGQPAQFADVRETLDVVAIVRDAETPIDELVYQWTATAGTFTGTGRTVTWTAPDSASTPPGGVTLTLKVIEAYGHPGQAKTFSQDVSGTQTVALHDSAKEIGDMSRQFLVDFSTTSLKDWQVVMRNFKRSACPVPREYDDERASVIDHYTNYTMHDYQVGPATVAVRFGGACATQGDLLPADACVSVRVMWDSTGPNGRGTTTGIDQLSAVYAVADSRWWLCSSRYEADTTFGHGFYSQ